MPPITDKKKKKGKAPAERPVRYPEVVDSICRGEKALTVEKAKELVGWKDSDVTGESYHLTDMEDKKVLLTNSTRNRPFDRRLAEKYAYEHLNKRWRFNGETIVVSRFGEVLSGQHRLASLILAEMIRQRDPQWQENWPGPVTMETVVILGVEETDDVVNTLDTGKPRSLSDTIYRGPYFADLAPKERVRAARACDWAIRLVQLRTGVEDAFNPRKSHGASLEFLDNHPTLVRCVRHVCEEDRGGAVSELVTPGYASALCYLMAACKSDPAEYVAKLREGDRREKYLDISMLKRAMEFWASAGKKETPELRALRDRLRTYAERKDSLGKPMEVPLDEKIAVLTLAWQHFADGKVPTLRDVTPRYENGAEGDPPLLKDPPRLGGIDMAGDSEEPDLKVDENGEVINDEEPAPHEKMRKDLEATRPERVKQRIKELAEAKKAKKEAMKAAVPPSNGSMLSVADEIRQQYDPIRKEHPGKLVFFKSRTSGGLTCIDADATKVSKLLGSPATKDPQGFIRFTISKSDLKEKMAKVLEAGLKVVVAEEVVSGMREKTVKAKDYVPE